MNQDILIKNSNLVNEGESFVADVLLSRGFIEQIGNIEIEPHHQVMDGTGKHLLQGIIDGQVHFRNPGLTHKGDLYTESKAAVAGGVTSYY